MNVSAEQIIEFRKMVKREAQAARARVREQRDILRSLGWQCTCEFRAMWLWKKTLDDGRIVLLREADAIKLEIG